MSGAARFNDIENGDWRMKRRALVTGANRGIGFEIAKGLVEQGHEVMLAGRDMDAVRKAATEIAAIPLQLDVGDADSISHAAKEAGAVDILVNNAGLMGSGTVLDDVDEWQRLMTVMVDGPHRLMHLLVPGMVERRYGRVVNLSSGWGSFAEGLAGPGAYGVAKAALNALTVAAARRKPRNVKINSMCPGWVHTDMGGPNAPRTPKEGADTAIWLATLDDKGPSGGFFRDRKPIAW